MNKSFITGMEIAGKKVAKIHNQLKDFLCVGMSTLEINNFCARLIKEEEMISGAFGYEGFPGDVCVSVNDCVCHGIPSEKIILKHGDLVSVDIAASYNGYFGDSCVTFVMGTPTKKQELILKAGYETMMKTIKLIKPGVCISVLGAQMESIAKSYGLYTVLDFCGHGIGKKMHEDPQIPFYYDPNFTYILKEGDAITIEPMVMENSPELKILSDGWSAVSKYKGLSVQFEHSVLVTKDSYKILTKNNYDSCLQSLFISNS